MSPALAERARAAFRAAFGPGEPQLFAAPGRVNLIGEHTDYNDGFVLPMPIGLGTIVAARSIEAAEIRVFADNLQDSDRFDLSLPLPRSEAAWANYVRGVASIMLEGGFALKGAQLAIAGDVPLGSGLSSSASLEVAAGRAIAALSGLDIRPRQLARIAQAAENDFAGCPCGIMDQLVVTEGKGGSALLIDCRSLETRPVALPDGIDILLADSGERHQLAAGGGYAERRRECEAAARQLGVVTLRDLDEARLALFEPAMDSLLFRRARHVVTENRRVLDAVAALDAGDVSALGELLVQSHASMRDDFAITTPRIDALAAFMNDALAGDGGARMTGGGFGGCVIALGRRPALEGLGAKLAGDGVRSFLARADGGS